MKQLKCTPEELEGIFYLVAGESYSQIIRIEIGKGLHDLTFLHSDIEDLLSQYKEGTFGLNPEGDFDYKILIEDSGTESTEIFLLIDHYLKESNHEEFLKTLTKYGNVKEFIKPVLQHPYGYKEWLEESAVVETFYPENHEQ